MTSVQPSFDFTLARRTDPSTSKAAGKAATFAQGHCRQILDCLTQHGPQTKDELAAHTGLDSVAVARRMASLRDQLLVRDSGTTRPTTTGRAATVWELRK